MIVWKWKIQEFSYAIWKKASEWHTYLYNAIISNFLVKCNLLFTCSCLVSPHQITPFAIPEMHRGHMASSKKLVLHLVKRGRLTCWSLLPSYFMERTPHRIIKCTFKQHTNHGWVVMCAWNWYSTLWSKNIKRKSEQALVRFLMY